MNEPSNGSEPSHDHGAHEPQEQSPRRDRSRNRTAVLWRTASDLSAAHATYVVATGGVCTDSKLESLLVDDAAQINTRLVNESVDVSRFWSQYLCEVAAQTPIDTACARALTSAGSNQWNSEQTGGAVTRRLVSARDVFSKKFPRLTDQLELRGQPLRIRWDTYGVGLLRQIDRLIWQGESPSHWWPASVEGLWVQPIRAGSGSHDSDNARFWMEAVLTDVDPMVSEVLRIAFLITGIAMERYTKSVSGESRVQNLWSVAAVPIVLAAAAELEVIPPGDLPVSNAMRLWQVGTEEMAKTVSSWWSEVSSLDEPLAMMIRRLDEGLNSIS